MRVRNLLVVATVLAFASGTIVAQAQTYVVQRPGQLPALVKRTPNGGFFCQNSWAAACIRETDAERQLCCQITRSAAGIRDTNAKWWLRCSNTRPTTGIRESDANWRLFRQNSRSVAEVRVSDGERWLYRLQARRQSIFRRAQVAARLRQHVNVHELARPQLAGSG